MFTSFGEILLSLIYISFFLFIIRKSSFFADSQLSKLYFYLGFVIKLAAGFMLTWIYTYYYTDRLAADIYKYFDDSQIMFDALKTNPSHFFAMLTGINENNDTIMAYYDTMLNWHKLDLVYNDNHILIRLNAFLRFFSFGYFSVHTIVMSFISYSGLVALFHLFKNKLACKNNLTFLVLLLTPSLLFWTSGMLKDGLLLGLFGLFIYQTDSILNKGLNIKRIVWLVFLCFLLVQIKLYVLMISLPGIALWVFLKNKDLPFLKSISIWVGTYAIFILVLGNIHHVIPRYDFPHMLAIKQYHFKRLAKDVESGSYIEIKDIKPSLVSIVQNAPNSFLTVLARPHLLESKSPLTLLAALENAAINLLLLLSFIILSLKKLKNPEKLYLFSIVFTVCIFILIGLVTPVMGAIVRYKTIALPFLIFIILYQINWEAIKFLKYFAKTE